jgi:Na+-transporting NADH:ubiquinone oxidoreductase subunit NqrF
MKRIKERKYPCYVCSQYSNYGKCKRTVIKEEILLTFFDKYCSVNKIEGVKHTYENISKFVKEVVLDSEQNLTVYYRDGYIQRLTNNLLQY